MLRRIIRRAVLRGRELGVNRPFMFELVPVVADLMKDVYPEPKDRQDYVTSLIKAEEEKFFRTLDAGMTRLTQQIEEVKSVGGSMLPGEAAFALHDTYGFPLELTQEIAQAEGIKVDTVGFDAAMEDQRRRAKESSDFASALVLNPGHMHSSLCASDGNPSQAVYVDATGCVGIGTTTPGAKLDVVGVIRVNNSGENNSIFEYLDTNGTLKKVTTSGVNQITFDATHVIADYSIGLRNFRGDKVGLESDASGTYLALAAGGASGSEKMRITSTGNVGIGTTSPSGKLDVNDNKVRIRMAKTPSSAGDTGNAGEVCWDSGYIYVCIATNSWVRGPLAAW